MKRILAVLILICVLCGCLAGFAACSTKKRADNVIYIRNLYFGKWSDFDDKYTKFIEEKFGVKFSDPKNDVKPASYDFNNWTQQVNSDLMGDLPDLFEANIDSYNFNTTYVRWAKSGTIKALPDEVFDENGRWSHLAKMLNSYDDIDYLKYKGKLYGIPVARNIAATDVPFAPFTYIYRKDVARKRGVVNENDIYEWDEFLNLLQTFKATDFSDGAIGDSEWGYPSILNFYKTSSHCFAIDATTGEVVNNYATEEYLKGLRDLKQNFAGLYLNRQVDYGQQQNKVKAEYANTQKIGVFYENLSMSNYQAIRDIISGTDKTAIMKVKGPDHKYALEEQEQWFSMSLIGKNASQKKLESILDIMDWLISEEGTRMALYGLEGIDYEIVNGEVSLLNEVTSLWYKKSRDGEYSQSAANNGARYLRYIVTLGNDLVDKDPLIQDSPKQKAAYDILKAWSDEMMEAYRNGELRILGEDRRVKWMQTESKQRNASTLLSEANSAVLVYTLGKGKGSIKTESDYINHMKSSTWKEVLKEINKELNK